MTDATAPAADPVAAALAEYRFPRIAPWCAPGGELPLPPAETLRAASETLVRFAVPRNAAVTRDKLTASVSAEDPNRATGSTGAFRALVFGRGAPERRSGATVPPSPDHRCVAMRLTVRKARGGRLELAFRASRSLVGILSFEHGADLFDHAIANPSSAKRTIEFVVGESLACVISALRQDFVGRKELDDACRRVAAAAQAGHARTPDRERYTYTPFATSGTIVLETWNPGPTWERVPLGEHERNLIARSDADLGRVASVSQGFHVPKPKLFDLAVGGGCVGLRPMSTADVLRGVAELEAMPGRTGANSDGTEGMREPPEGGRNP